MATLEHIQWVSLFLSRYLKEANETEVLVKDLKNIYGKIRLYRRLFQIFNFISLFRDVIQVKNKKINFIHQSSWYLSKMSYIIYYVVDNVFVVYLSSVGVKLKEMRGDLRKLWQYAYIFRLLGNIFSSIFYTQCLLFSYQQEKKLAFLIPGNFSPSQVVNCLKKLSNERKVLTLNLLKVFCDLFISLHFSKLGENLLNTQIKRLFMSICGIISSLCQIISQNILKIQDPCPRTTKKILALTLNQQ